MTRGNQRDRAREKATKEAQAKGKKQSGNPQQRNEQDAKIMAEKKAVCPILSRYSVSACVTVLPACQAVSRVRMTITDRSHKQLSKVVGRKRRVETDGRLGTKRYNVWKTDSQAKDALAAAIANGTAPPEATKASKKAPPAAAPKVTKG
ncbi:hypothetical protein TREMEDRAFT_65352 [Tremella mesenterica DSM 1558]|uniref:uncharacterized protein n=1 Tax=Tremella mesenterica (strain ATCC 24925 / CBS 8224 / DSM 1558 / NBRC 9311 / NRRL Y-6157 / RJB 2259-6 / UBC 559-6) TaxID=578456 RepID=UPI00032CA67A|nr:uncharacterized protein TREMEDRAFT_65352 [Tremella mesenterica DSM 1558]EIW66490.1 hypothetical protein TREMEDRAFT_65352 [Tremella mesenterica DSM 1558]